MGLNVKNLAHVPTLRASLLGDVHHHQVHEALLHLVYDDNQSPSLKRSKREVDRHPVTLQSGYNGVVTSFKTAV